MSIFDRLTGKKVQHKSVFAFGQVEQPLDNKYVKQALGPVADAMKPVILPKGIDPKKAKPYLPLFEQAAEETGIDRDILLKQAQAESSFNPEAQSKAGAKGIMQIIPKYHPEVGDPNDPKQAVPYAAKYLKQLMDKYAGDVRKALAAYNFGPTNLDKLIKKRGEDWESHLPDETSGYVTKIAGERMDDVYEDQNGRYYKDVNGTLVETD